MSLEETTSPNGEGSIRRYFCGDEAAAAADVTGAHLLRLGDAGFMRGSNSMLLFRVAPQAMAGVGSRPPAPINNTKRKLPHRAADRCHRTQAGLLVPPRTG